ncbi:MAG TPA: radical SAM family heme chaperone HemW [Geobacteraceae bacterium]|nr:radical SAM family heme chaperone HemW [Geobacteraceae bacterium]
MRSNTNISLYFHIPFCLKKCLYCSFYSVDQGYFPLDEYVDALVREMRLCREKFDIPFSARTLYIGGGTPSIMNPLHVEKIVGEAAKLFGVTSDAEITMEANPGTLTREKLIGYKRSGVNRLSLGIQSFNDSNLERLGRVHTVTQAFEAFHAARSHGFANMGIDLICSLPGQTLRMWEDDLLSAVAMGPEHMSVYGLTIEEGTPFAEMEKQGALLLPDEDESADMYECAADILCGSGYEHYEISNFARQGYRSRHNQVYWHRDTCLGFGSGAHSFMTEPGFGVRWRNPDNLGKYLEAVKESRLPWRDRHCPTLREAMSERLFLGLRLLDGVDLRLFRDEFGVDFEDAYPEECSKLLAKGFIEISGGKLRLAQKSLLISNQIFVMFV